MFDRTFIPNLNALRVFETAGRHLSFKLAAQELHVTPSAVSQQIKNLELELGIALFKRHNRLLALTPAGQTYWEQIHDALAHIHRHTSALVNGDQAVLKVSLMPPVANRIVLPKLRHFHARSGEVDLRIDSSQKLRNVAKGEVDVAIRFGAAESDHEVCEKVCDVYVQVVCPPGFSARYDLSGKPRNMRRVPIIQMSQSPGVWTRWINESGLEIRLEGKQHVVDNYPSAIQAAETLGAMLAMMPIETELVREGRLETPFPPVGPIEKSIYAVYKRDSARMASIRLFIDWLKDEVRALGFDIPSD